MGGRWRTSPEGYSLSCVLISLCSISQAVCLGSLGDGECLFYEEALPCWKRSFQTACNYQPSHSFFLCHMMCLGLAVTRQCVINHTPISLPACLSVCLSSCYQDCSTKHYEWILTKLCSHKLSYHRKGLISLWCSFQFKENRMLFSAIFMCGRVNKSSLQHSHGWRSCDVVSQSPAP